MLPPGPLPGGTTSLLRGGAGSWPSADAAHLPRITPWASRRPWPGRKPRSEGSSCSAARRGRCSKPSVLLSCGSRREPSPLPITCSSLGAGVTYLEPHTRGASCTRGTRVGVPCLGLCSGTMGWISFAPAAGAQPIARHPRKRSPAPGRQREACRLLDGLARCRRRLSRRRGGEAVPAPLSDSGSQPVMPTSLPLTAPSKAAASGPDRERTKAWS